MLTSSASSFAHSPFGPLQFRSLYDRHSFCSLSEANKICATSPLRWQNSKSPCILEPSNDNSIVTLQNEDILLPLVSTSLELKSKKWDQQHKQFEQKLWESLEKVESPKDVELLLHDETVSYPMLCEIIRKLGRRGRIEAATALFKWLNIRPPSSVGQLELMFNSYLNALHMNGCLDTTNQLLEEMTQRGIMASKNTFEVMIHAFILQDRIEEAVEFFYKFENSGIIVGTSTYRMMIQALLRRGDIEKSILLFTRMKNSFIQEKSTLIESNASIDQIHQEDCQKCVEDIAIVKDHLIDLCLARLEDGLANEESRHSLSLFFQKMEDAELEPNHAACRILLVQLGRVDDHMIAKVLYYYMRKKSFQLDTPTCNHIIRIMGHGKKWWAALEVFENMSEMGPRPNETTYRLIHSYFKILLSAANRKHIWKWAQQLINKMIEKGLEPSRYAWNMALISCAKAGQSTAAVQVFQRMISHKQMPDVFSFGALLSALEKDGLVDEAWNVWKMMRKVGVTPNDPAYTTMISACGKAGRYEEIAFLVKDMEDSGVGLSLITYNSLITAYARGGHAQHALNCLEKMRIAKIKPDSITYNKAVEALSNGGQCKLAISMYCQMRELKLAQSPSAYDAIIRACRINHVFINVGLLGPRPPKATKRARR